MCKTTTKEFEVVETGKKKLYAATVEEALTMTGFGKYNFGLLLVCSWSLQAMGMDMFGSSFVVAAAVCDLQLTLHQRGLLTAVPLLGVLAGALLWGYVSDTKGRRLTLVLSMSIGFVFAALSSLSPNWQTMAVLKLLSATFTSASNSGAYTLVGECCSERARGKAMLLCTCALMCSQAATAVFAYPILPLEFSYHINCLGINFRSWRLLALVISLPCAVNACLLHLFHESPKFLATQRRYEEALHVLKSIYATNTGKDAGSFPVQKILEDSENQSSTVCQDTFFRCIWRQTVPLFRAPLLKETLRLFYLVAVIYMTGSGFIMWLPYIMNNLFFVLEAGGGDGMNLCAVIKYSSMDFKTGNMTDTEICDDKVQDTTLFSAMTYGAMACGSNLVLSLICGTRKRVTLMGILAMSATSAVLLNVVAVPLAGGIFFLFFLLCALSMGILSVYFVERYPTSLRGMVSCLSVMLGRISGFLGVNAIGVLISTSCEATFYGWSVLMISAIVVAWFLPRDKPPKN